MAGFFPIFFKQYWSGGVDPAESTLRLGLTNAGASLLVLLLAPLIGALADGWGARKRLLLLFALLAMLATALLPLVAAGAWQWAALLYLIGNIGFAGSVGLYDALLLSVAPRQRLDVVSGLGFALGYLGGGLLFALQVWLVSDPTRFGLADSAAAVRVSLLSVAIWWGLFSLPLLWWVEEPAGRTASVTTALRQALAQLTATLRELRQLRVVTTFLAAYWLYIDGVDTIVRMAVDYGLALGFAADSLLLALLLTQLVGFPAALLFGWLGARIGPQRGLYLALWVYLLVVVWASQMTTVSQFYTLAVVVGLVQGGVQSLSRSLYARLIPPERAGEFFGFYNMMGRFAAIFGPLLVGWTAALSGSSRLSLLSVALLFIAGLLLLMRVDVSASAPLRREQ